MSQENSCGLLVPSLPGIIGMHIVNAYAAVRDLPEAITPSPCLRDTTFGYSPLIQMRMIARPSAPLPAIPDPGPQTSALSTSSTPMSSAPLSGPFNMASQQLPPRGYHHQLYTPIKNYSNSFSRERKQDESLVAAMKLPQSSEDLPREPVEADQPSMQDQELYQPPNGQHPQPGSQSDAEHRIQEHIQPHAQQFSPQQASENACASAQLHAQPHHELHQQQYEQPQQQPQQLPNAQPSGRGQPKANTDKITCDLCGRLKAAIGGEWYKSLKCMAEDGFDYCAVSWRWEYTQKQKGVVINVEQVVERNEALSLQNQAAMSFKDIIKLMKETNTGMGYQNDNPMPHDDRIEQIGESNAGVGHQNNYAMPYDDRIEQIGRNSAGLGHHNHYAVPYDNRIEQIGRSNVGLGHQNQYAMPYDDRIQNGASHAEHMSESNAGMGHQNYYAMPYNDKVEQIGRSNAGMGHQNQYAMAYDDRIQNVAPYAEQTSEGNAGMGHQNQMPYDVRIQNPAPYTSLSGQQNLPLSRQLAEDMSRIRAPLGRMMETLAPYRPQQHHRYLQDFSNDVAIPDGQGMQVSAAQKPHQYQQYLYDFSKHTAAPDRNSVEPSPPKAHARQHLQPPQNGEGAAPQRTRKRPLRQPIESDKLVLCSLCGRSKFERPNDWHNTRWKFQEDDPLGYCKNCYTKNMNEKKKLRAEERRKLI